LIKEKREKMGREHVKRKAIELINKAYYLVESGNFWEAKKLLSKALDICDEIPDGHNELGLVYCHLGDYPSAYHHALRAIELDSTNPKFHNSLAFALMSMNRLDEALISAYTAIKLDPGYASAHLLVSRILEKMGRTDKEISHHKEITRKIYDRTGERSDGTPLRKKDLERLFSDLEKIIKIPESTESFEVKGIKWALIQIREDPFVLIKNKTVREAITNPIIRWFFVIIVPIATFLGIIAFKQPIIEQRMYLMMSGLFLVFFAIITEKIFINPRLRAVFSLSGKRINPQTPKISIEIVKSTGYGMIAYCLGTFVHKTFESYELIIALVSLILLVKGTLNLGKKHGWYATASPKKEDYTIRDNIYTNKKYGFSISFPEDWEIETEGLSSGVLVLSFNSSEKSVSMNVAVNVIYGFNPSKAGIIDFAETYVQQIYSNLHSNEKGSIITLNVSEKCKKFPAIQVDYSFFGRHHRKIAFFLKFRPYGGYEFLITCGASKNKFSRYENTFNQCVQTFRF
jgi:tetratricopeptide (TPR) repeat protein